MTRVGRAAACLTVLLAWNQAKAQPAPSPPVEAPAAPAASPPPSNEMAFAVRTKKLDISRLFKGVWFGTKRFAVFPCTPSTEAGQAIMGDLQNRVGVALAKNGIAQSVDAIDGPDTPGCPDAKTAKAMARKINAEYLVAVELRDTEVSDGEVPVVLHLLEETGVEEGTYAPEGLVVAGPADSKKILQLRAITRFQRQAWTKDYRVTITRVYQRGMSSMFVNRTPIIRDEKNREMAPEDVEAAPGMENVKGRARTLQTTNLLTTILSYARWGFCLGGPLAGVVLGLVFAIPVAVVGVMQAGPTGIAGALGAGCMGGLVVGCCGGWLGLCVTTGVQDIVSLVAYFVRGSFVDEAINTHNKGVAQEVGVEPEDVDKEEYFP